MVDVDMIYLIGMIVVAVAYGVIIFYQPYDPNERSDLPPPGLF
jgi:hypothetical protein